MSEKLRAFVFGFTNAFTPVDYSEINKIGEISRRINTKMNPHRRFTREQIDEITAQSGKSKISRASAS